MAATSPSTTSGNRFAPITSDNHSGSLWIASILCLIYGVLTLTLRGHIKFRIYGLDDWLIAVATVTQLAQSIALFIALKNGLGATSTLSSVAQLTKAGQATFASQILFILSLCLSKCSILLLMMRLFNLDMHHSWRKSSNRRFLWAACLIVLGLIVLWGLASMIGLSVDCSSRTLIEDPASAQCPDQLLRWRLIIAFDIATELVLFSLPLFIVWPVQMSIARKGQVVLAFAFRLGVAALAVVHLHYVAKYVDAPRTSFSIIPALVWQQIELCWALLTASIPNLKAFMKSFNSGFGLENTATDGYGLGYGGATHGSQVSEGYQLGSVKNHEPVPKLAHVSQQESVNRPFADNLRPDFVDYSTTIEHENANKERSEARSIESGGSQDMIIRKDVQYDVRYEQPEK